MNAALIFRSAVSGDMPRIAAIIRQAQAQMRAAGSRQWQDGYPAPEDIEADIARAYGYVLSKPAAADTEAVIAYGAVVFGTEKAYEQIEGAWLTDGDYTVVHRLAVADGEKGRGVAAEFMRRVEALARTAGVGALRIDTNFDNRYMLQLVARAGFVYCGKIQYASGERLAFEKRLEK